MLTQEAADYLARVAKQITSAGVLVVPGQGGHAEWQAVSRQDNHRFASHMRRGRRAASKAALQERYETNEILLRLDLDGAPHCNPDGSIISTPHLHIYRQGYDDKWAFPVPADLDISSGDPAQILINFLTYCGVWPIPPVQGGVLP